MGIEIIILVLLIGVIIYVAYDIATKKKDQPEGKTGGPDTKPDSGDGKKPGEGDADSKA